MRFADALEAGALPDLVWVTLDGTAACDDQEGHEPGLREVALAMGRRTDPHDPHAWSNLFRSTPTLNELLQTRVRPDFQPTPEQEAASPTPPHWPQPPSAWEAFVALTEHAPEEGAELEEMLTEALEQMTEDQAGE